jgi:hypothetical protein
MRQTGAVADITLVKGETAALDRTWLANPDGPGWQVALHAVHDLPHLVVESVFGLPDGLWGVLASGGFSAANRDRTRRYGRRARLVTDAPLDDLAQRNWPGHIVAKAATNAVMNRWQDGPDSPDGVRARLRAGRPGPDAEFDRRVAVLLDRVTDAAIERAITGTRYLGLTWAGLAPGGTLRLHWPLTPGAIGVWPPPGG